MLDRFILVALTPLALAGGAATSWVRSNLVGSTGEVAVAASARPSSARLAMVRGSDGLLHTTVRINGVFVDMILDTGASRTILSDRDAVRVFGEKRGEYATQVRTLGGQHALRLETAQQVELSGRTFRDLEAGLVDGAEVSVLGLDWLRLTGPVTIPAND